MSFGTNSLQVDKANKGKKIQMACIKQPNARLYIKFLFAFAGLSHFYIIA